MLLTLLIMKLTKINCAECSKDFTPTNKRNIYCSDGCKQEAYRKRNGIARPEFLDKKDKYHVFKSEKTEVVYREVIRREYTELEKKISRLNIDLKSVKNEKSAIENKISKLLSRNSSFIGKKLATITTFAIGIGLGGVIALLMRNRVTRMSVFLLSVPFIVIVGVLALAFQKDSDKEYENEIIKLPDYRSKVIELDNKEKSIQIDIEYESDMLSKIPKFERLTEEKTREIEEKIKLPRYNLPQISENNAKDTMTVKELQMAQFKVLKFDAEWKSLIGCPEGNFSMMIYGVPGQGKTTLAIKLAEYLSNNFGKVVYNSSEEGISLSLQGKMKNINSNNFFLTTYNDFESLRKYLKKSTSKFIVIDSINHMNITSDQLEELRMIDMTRGFISIHQVTKSGDFKGENKYLHNCDIEIVVDNYNPIVKKNRYKFS